MFVSFAGCFWCCVLVCSHACVCLFPLVFWFAESDVVYLLILLVFWFIALVCRGCFGFVCCRLGFVYVAFVVVYNFLID